MKKEQYTDQQLVELLERRSPKHPRMIDRFMMQAFLDGKLVLQDEAVSGKGKVITTSEFVERLIKAGFHKATDGGKGMEASAYRKLWPKTVVQPVSYAGRFDELLLVDLTITLDRLVKISNFFSIIRPEDCQNLVSSPMGKDGKMLLRYIAFIQLGKKNLGRTVEDCRKTFASDEVGLVLAEGLHLPVEHESYLRQYAVDLPGSACGKFAPFVVWVAVDRPYFDANLAQAAHPHYGSASRGSEVIPLS